MCQVEGHEAPQCPKFFNPTRMPPGTVCQFCGSPSHIAPSAHHCALHRLSIGLQEDHDVTGRKSSALIVETGVIIRMSVKQLPVNHRIRETTMALLSYSRIKL